MAHQLQLEKAKYRQWVKAGLGLGYLKDGLAPFCQDLSIQQHKDMLYNIQQTKCLPLPVKCVTCNLRSLKPDHVKIGNKVCPYGQVNCNCWFPSGKISCPGKICGTIYDFIIQNYASTPPAPNWKNTDSRMWTSDPWSIARCYINAPGYDQKKSAADTDCTGLLHVIMNDRYYHNHISCNVSGASIFSKLRQYRNNIFHSSNMELEEAEANSYIDDMITVLQDGKELVYQPAAHQAVQKLVKLKHKDFIVTSESFEEILKQMKEEMVNVLKSTESTKDECQVLKMKLSSVTTLLKQITESNKEQFDGLKTLVSEQGKEIQRLRQADSPEKKQLAYEKAKSELQRQMIDRYRETLLQVSVLPLNPEIHKCSFSEIYIRPKITREIEGEKGETKEQEVNLMSEIFQKNRIPQKSVYVIGEAGTGKSSFCKYLVNCWCMAHSEEYLAANVEYETKESENTEGNEKHEDDNVSSEESEYGSIEFEYDSDEFENFKEHETDTQEIELHMKEYEHNFDGAKEMRKFDFLFHIALRRYQNIASIHEMLKKHYDTKILEELLEKDSAKIIIVLDGLDEWSSETITNNQFKTEGLPERDFLKNYTIVTTSRPWKIHSLRIIETKIQQLLKLKGFDDKSELLMICRTVSNINSKRGGIKDINDCRRKMGEESLRSLKQVPIMLQQLICLWFDGKLDQSSRCAVYTGMLELFFTWNEDKTAGTSSENIEEYQAVELPEYLADKEIFELNSHLIYDISRMAYETLFNCPKDKALTFDISVFRKILNISNRVRISCLKLGILTEDRCHSLSVSERPKYMFSFIHKSVQEFFAALHIAINFKTKMNSLSNSENADLQREYIPFLNDVFRNCSTVNEILEHLNVVIMLHGLEPRLATHASRYIYDIVERDLLVQRYRTSVDSDIIDGDYRCIRDIQDLIFDSMKECYACLEENFPTFYIADLIIKESNECHNVCSSVNQEQITTKFVHSIDVENINTVNVEFSKYLPRFKHVEKIKIMYDTLKSLSTENVDHMIDDLNESVAETIKINASTLKTISLSFSSSHKMFSLGKNIVCVLPSLKNLVAIKMTLSLSHEDTSRFCEFLDGTSHLEQIHIYIVCECRKQHDVDLSKHQHLQYLFWCNEDVYLTCFNTTNIEVFRLRNMKNTNNMMISDSIRKCDKLKELELSLDINNRYHSYHINITEKLVSVLPFLHNLTKLKLYRFSLTNSIIQFPSEIKCLRLIDLSDVRLSLTTWKKFVDSLPDIPHPVEVCIYDCYITNDGEEFNVDMLPFGTEQGGKENEARQYIRDQKKIFYVKDDAWYFSFSTKKQGKTPATFR